MTGTGKNGKEGGTKRPGRKDAARRPAKPAAVHGRASETLTETADKYKLLIEATNTGFVILDDHGRVLDANPEYVRMTGHVRLKEILGHPVTEWTAPYDKERNAAEVKECLKTGSVRNLVIDYVHASGTVVPIEINATVLPGKPSLRIMTVCRDITERRLAEERLNMNEERYRALYTRTPAMLHSIDSDGRLLSVSDEWLLRLGYRREEVLGRKSTDFLTAESRRYAVETVLPEFYRTGFCTQVPYQIVTKEGRVLDVLLSATSERDLEGRVLRSLAILEDITDRKRAEQMLRESEGRLRTITEHAPDTILQVDRQGAITFINRPIPGLEKEKIVGTTVYQWVPKESHPVVAHALEQAFATGKRQEYESAGPGPNGAERFYSVRVMPVVIGERVDSAIYIATDITERKRAETALAHSHDLMRYVIEHTRSSIAVHDRDLKYIYVSQRYLDEYNVKERDIIGKHHYEVFPDLPQKWRDVHQRVLAGEVLSAEDDPYPREDGTVDRTRWECRPWYESSGAIGGIIVYTEIITERKRVEEALRTSEAKLNTILDNVGAYIFIKDTAYRYTYVNRKVCELLGGSADEIIGTGDDAFFSPASVVEIMKSDRPVIERGETITREETDLTPIDGIARSYWTVKLPLRDSAGTVVGLCGISTDITERKRAELALRASENRTRSIIESIPVGMHMYRLEPDGRLVFTGANPAADRILGVNNSSFIGKTIEEAFPPLTETEVPRRYREVVTTGKSWQTESISYEDKSIRGAFDVHAFRTGTDSMVAAFEDITERKRAEDALRQSEERFRDLAESLPLAVFEMDLEGRFTYVNRSAMETFGYTQQDFAAGISMEQVVSPPDRNRARENMSRKIAGSREGYVEYHGMRKDGSLFPITVASSPILRDGRPVGLRGIVTDLSERKNLEQEQLKAQKLESIGTLAGGIAHDFNNLLQGVFGYISMAKLSFGQREKSLAMLEQAEHALHRSVALTTQLLTFSKGGKPVKKVVALPQIIEDACRFALSGSRTICRIESDEDLWSVEADAGQIGQVIQNVVLNADQSMPTGGTVTVRARNVPEGSTAAPGTDGGRHVEISIKDDGVGIPAEFLSKIFDPYFTTKEKGSGLGLTTSYSIIRNHGGMITASSEPGKGSTFTILLPAVDRPPETAAHGAAPRWVRSGRVLVMDDDEVIRKVAMELVQSLGHEVEVAVNGEQVIERFLHARQAGRPFDVVILDLTVRGGLGGAETMRRLREIDPGVRAVVSSGYSDDDIVADSRRHGFQAFLKKPYDLSRLDAVLSSLLDRSAER